MDERVARYFSERFGNDQPAPKSIQGLSAYRFQDGPLFPGVGVNTEPLEQGQTVKFTIGEGERVEVYWLGTCGKLISRKRNMKRVAKGRGAQRKDGES